MPRSRRARRTARAFRCDLSSRRAWRAARRPTARPRSRAARGSSCTGARCWPGRSPRARAFRRARRPRAPTASAPASSARPRRSARRRRARRARRSTARSARSDRSRARRAAAPASAAQTPRPRRARTPAAAAHPTRPAPRARPNTGSSSSRSACRSARSAARSSPAARRRTAARSCRPAFALAAGAAFALLTLVLLLAARANDPTARYAPWIVALAALAVGVLSAAVVRWTLVRWQSALAVGVLGGTLALAGSDPASTAHLYTNFLSLLSTWAAPWAGVLLATRGETRDRIGTRALFAWLAGIAASLPFWQQSWFIGPLAAAHPQLGDLSYFVSFGVAFALASVLRATPAPAPA